MGKSKRENKENLKKGKMIMKIFGYSSSEAARGYGIECGVVIADSEKEAREILINEALDSEFSSVFEIPMQKGFTWIGSYEE